MTQTAFIEYYCTNSIDDPTKQTRLSIENKLNADGKFAIPCECGQDDCLGWQYAKTVRDENNKPVAIRVL